MNQLQKTFKVVGEGINKNSPSILIGLGISGMVGSLVMAVRTTPKAVEAVEDVLYDQYLDAKEEFGYETFPAYLASISKEGYVTSDWLTVLEPKKTAEVVLPYYLPTIAMATLSITAIFMGNRIHLRRAAALASLYSLAEGTLKTYQEKVLETVGEKTAKEIHGEVAGEQMKNSTIDMIHNQGGGYELCFDMFTGRYFMSTADKIRHAVNEFNEQLLSEDLKSLNELYYDLGLPSVELGHKVGWKLENGLVDLILGTQIAADERPCLTLDFRNRPSYLHS